MKTSVKVERESFSIATLSPEASASIQIFCQTLLLIIDLVPDSMWVASGRQKCSEGKLV